LHAEAVDHVAGATSRAQQARGTVRVTPWGSQRCRQEQQEHAEHSQTVTVFPLLVAGLALSLTSLSQSNLGWLSKLEIWRDELTASGHK
jgi:hypothetical protein